MLEIKTLPYTDKDIAHGILWFTKYMKYTGGHPKLAWYLQSIKQEKKIN